MQVKLLLVTFYLNGRLHAVFIGKPSEWMSKFWDGSVFKNRILTEFWFLHIPDSSCLSGRACKPCLPHCSICHWAHVKANIITLKTKT